MKPWLSLVLFSAILVWNTGNVITASTSGSVTDSPDVGRTYIEAWQEYPVVIHEEELYLLTFNVTLTNVTTLRIVSTDTEIVKIINQDLYNELGQTNISVKVFGIFLGRSFLKFYLNDSLSDVRTVSDETTYDDQWYQLPQTFEVVVKRKETVLNTIFTVSVIVLVCLANVAMGCKTDLQIVKETLMKPVAPVTGIVSQFLLMPMITFGLGYALSLDASLAFGLFATGCAPGGAASNVYTYLLDGNVSLSVTMTFVSTLLSLGMVPLWLFTLGVRVIYKGISISIPFENIVTSLLGLIIPVIIGLIIQRKKPNWAKFILKCVKPISIIFLIVVFTLGIYANLYIFKILKPLVLLAGALAPYCGFLFGALVAALTKQPKKNILTIAIETGIQNTGVAIVLLQLSLPPPDSEISIVPPIAAAIFTPFPLITAIVIHEIRKRCFSKKESETVISEKDEHHPVPQADDDSVKMVSYASS